MLGQPVSMLLPEVIGFQPDRQAQGRRHRHRPRADRHADAAQEGRRRQVRRVLRPRPLQHDARRPRHDRQHGAGIRRDLRLLPGRCRDHPLPHHVRPRREPHRAGRSLFARRRACGATTDSADPVFTDLLELDLGDRRAVDGRPEASRGPRRAGRHRRRLRQGDGDRIQEDRSTSTPATPSRAPTTISAMATSSSPPSPPAPTPPTRAC